MNYKAVKEVISVVESIMLAAKERFMEADYWKGEISTIEESTDRDFIYVKKSFVRQNNEEYYKVTYTFKFDEVGRFKGLYEIVDGNWVLLNALTWERKHAKKSNSSEGS